MHTIIKQGYQRISRRKHYRDYTDMLSLRTFHRSIWRQEIIRAPYALQIACKVFGKAQQWTTQYYDGRQETQAQRLSRDPSGRFYQLQVIMGRYANGELSHGTALLKARKSMRSTLLSDTRRTSINHEHASACRIYRRSRPCYITRTPIPLSTRKPKALVGTRLNPGERDSRRNPFFDTHGYCHRLPFIAQCFSSFKSWHQYQHLH